MRDSNYHSVANNRAAVTITTSLYDRRALDVTSDKPLVNSLNHLTYLVSSSAKVRETLSNDGGLERLVEILHECQLSSFTIRDNVFNGEKKLLTAWKWTLAFQCLVLIGTRGTESIRQKVVRAGMLPVIATVLDNYIYLHEGTFFGATACSAQGLAQFCPNTGAQSGPARSHSQVSSAGQPQTQSQVHASRHNYAPEPRQSQQDLASDVYSNSVEDGSPNSHRHTGDIQSNSPEDVRGILDIQLNETRGSRTTNHRNDSLAPSHTLTSSIRDGFPRNTFETLPRESNLSLSSIDDYEKLSIEQSFLLIRESFRLNPGANISSHTTRSMINNDIRRRCLIMNIIEKLKHQKDREVIYPYDMDDREYDMDTCLQFLSDLYLQDEPSSHIANAYHSKIAPRSFTDTGIVIPRDDDVVWCLQLLAYISKYPYLKDVLQNTHLIFDMSIRDKHLHLQSKEVFKSKCKFREKTATRETLVPRSRTGQSFSPSQSAQFSHAHSSNEASAAISSRSASGSPEISCLNIRNDNLDDTNNDLELCSENYECATPEHCNGSDIDVAKASGGNRELKFSDPTKGNHPECQGNLCVPSQRPARLNNLLQEVAQAEAIIDDLERELTLFELSDKINDCIEEECHELSMKIIEKRAKEKDYLSKVWNYDTYDKFDIDDTDLTGDHDFDMSLMEYKKSSLFPVVEKFTFLAGTDMYYWSGVIMRNSCRRNDHKGGVRQCGNLECGKWEQTPREFSKCKRCKRTKYCSRDCQMRAWHSHKNWCVLSNSSTSTNPTDSANLENDGQHERTVHMGTAPSDSEGIHSNTDEIPQHASASNQETQYSDL